MDYEYYQNRFANPSDCYKRFVRDYITQAAMIAGRGEEDISVWDKLEGEELEAAKDFILRHLEENPKWPYIRAAGIFRDPEAVPILEKVIDAFPERFSCEKLYAAKTLHDWTGYEAYTDMLESACSNAAEPNLSFLQISVSAFTDGLDEAEKQKIYRMLNITPRPLAPPSAKTREAQMKRKRIFSKVCVPLGAALLFISMIYLRLACYVYVNGDGGKLQIYIPLLVLTWIFGIQALVMGYFMNPKRIQWVFASLIILSISIGLFGVNHTAMTEFITARMYYQSTDTMYFAWIHLLYAIPTLAISAVFYRLSIKRIRQQRATETGNALSKNNVAKAKELIRNIGAILVAFLSSVAFFYYWFMVELSRFVYLESVPQHTDTPADYFGFISWPSMGVVLMIPMVLLIVSYFIKVKWIHWQYFLIGMICAKAIIIRVMRGIVTHAGGYPWDMVMFFPSQIVFFIPLLVLCIWLFVLSIKRNEQNDVLEAA